MKRVLLFVTAALVSLPLAAAETKQQDPAPPAESPMVAAAKKANRGTSKTTVITNESLKDAKGHVTTTTIVSTLNVPKPEPTVEMKHREQQKKNAEVQAKAAEAEKKKEDEKKAREMRLATAAESYEGGYSDGDPAVVEKQLDDAAKAAAAAQKKP